MKKIIIISFLLLSILANAKITVGNLTYNIISETDKTVEVTYIEGSPAVSGFVKYSMSDLAIPETITYNNEEYTVTAIGDFAFFDSKLINVVIPKTVASIGIESFCRCQELRSVTIDSSNLTIDIAAFSQSDRIEKIIINSENTPYIKQWMVQNYPLGKSLV